MVGFGKNLERILLARQAWMRALRLRGDWQEAVSFFLRPSHSSSPATTTTNPQSFLSSSPSLSNSGSSSSKMGPTVDAAAHRGNHPRGLRQRENELRKKESSSDVVTASWSLDQVSSIFKILLEAGKYDMLHQLRWLAITECSVESRQQVFESFIQTYANEGKVYEALQCIGEMKMAGITVSPRAYASILRIALEQEEDEVEDVTSFTSSRIKDSHRSGKVVADITTGSSNKSRKTVLGASSERSTASVSRNRRRFFAERLFLEACTAASSGSFLSSSSSASSSRSFSALISHQEKKMNEALARPIAAVLANRYNPVKMYEQIQRINRPTQGGFNARVTTTSSPEEIMLSLARRPTAKLLYTKGTGELIDEVTHLLLSRSQWCSAFALLNTIMINAEADFYDVVVRPPPPPRNQKHHISSSSSLSFLNEDEEMNKESNNGNPHPEVHFYQLLSAFSTSSQSTAKGGGALNRSVPTVLERLPPSLFFSLLVLCSHKARDVLHRKHTLDILLRHYKALHLVGMGPPSTPIVALMIGLCPVSLWSTAVSIFQAGVPTLFGTSSACRRLVEKASFSSCIDQQDAQEEEEEDMLGGVLADDEAEALATEAAAELRCIRKILRLLNHSSHWKEAIQLFDALPSAAQNSPACTNLVMRSWALAGKWETAISIAEKAKIKLEHSRESFRTGQQQRTSSSFSVPNNKFGNVRSSNETATRILQLSREYLLDAGIAYALRETSCWEQSMQLFQRVFADPSRPLASTVVEDVLCTLYHASRWEEALACFERAFCPGEAKSEQNERGPTTAAGDRFLERRHWQVAGTVQPSDRCVRQVSLLLWSARCKAVALHWHDWMVQRNGSIHHLLITAAVALSFVSPVQQEQGEEERVLRPIAKRLSTQLKFERCVLQLVYELHHYTAPAAADVDVNVDTASSPEPSSIKSNQQAVGPAVTATWEKAIRCIELLSSDISNADALESSSSSISKFSRDDLVPALFEQGLLPPEQLMRFME